MKDKEIPLPEEKDRLLFIRFSSLGDVLLALAKARALKTRFPGLHLAWLAQAEYEGILRMQPYVDEVVPWDIGKGRLTVLQLIGRIRQADFRFLYSVHYNDRSALVSAFSGIPVRVGFHKNLQFAYDYSLAEANRAWELGKFLTKEVQLHVSEEEKAKLFEKMPVKEGRFVFCAIGASKTFKRWPVRSWTVFLEEACRAGLIPVLVGSGLDEEKMGGEIVSSSHAPVINLAGRLSLEEVCALAASSDLAIGGDTGPIHLARMTGIPCIGLFAVRDPGRFGHKGQNLFALVSDNPFENYPETSPKDMPMASLAPEKAVSLMRKVIEAKREGNY